jgi:lysozyme family protein
MSTFERAFAIVVGHEGGYDATQADPGNWTGGTVGAGVLRGTKYGISAAAYPTVDIANLTLPDAQAIYRRDYWDALASDRLPPPLALLVFDAGVNNGCGRSTRWLQGVVGAVADGIIGDETLAAVDTYLTARGSAALCAEFMAQRLSFMAGLPTWPVFGLGWARRLCALPYQSLTLADGAA